MRFSIVVPVYNADAYLRECIDSVRAQTYADFELLLIDDGSTDESPLICDEAAAKDTRIHVRHGENAGPIAARRAGICAARGDYTVFADADDMLMPEALETIQSCIKETGADMVIYNNVSRFPGGDVLTPAVFPDGSIFVGADKTKLYGALIEGWRLNNLWTKAIQTRLLQSDDTDYARYYDNPNADDLLMTLCPITHAERVVYLDKPLYVYRRIEGSISSRVLTGRIDRQINEPVMEQLRRYMTVWGMDTPEWQRRYYSRRLFGIVSLFWQHYRAADGAAARRSVLDYPWERHIPAEGRPYLSDNTLSLGKRIQLNAILRRNKPLLDIIERFGALRMRARREK